MDAVPPIAVSAETPATHGTHAGPGSGNSFSPWFQPTPARTAVARPPMAVPQRRKSLRNDSRSSFSSLTSAFGSTPAGPDPDAGLESSAAAYLSGVGDVVASDAPEHV